MNTIVKNVAQVTLKLVHNEENPYVLEMETEENYFKGSLNDLYIDEHDGTSLTELVPAFASRLPEDYVAYSNHSNYKPEVWIKSCHDDKLAALHDAEVTIKVIDEYEEDEDGDLDWSKRTVELVSFVKA